MTNEALTARVAQALFAVGVTIASVLLIQFAMLVGVKCGRSMLFARAMSNSVYAWPSP
jgi:hypothetical protein